MSKCDRPQLACFSDDLGQGQKLTYRQDMFREVFDLRQAITLGPDDNSCDGSSASIRPLASRDSRNLTCHSGVETHT